MALLADTIHNFGDAAAAIPLWIAFVLARRKPTRPFTYGLGRVEDLAGVAIVFLILFSALVAGYASIERFFNTSWSTRTMAYPPIPINGWLFSEELMPVSSFNNLWDNGQGCRSPPG